MRAQVLCLLALAALAGCSRDLSLPEEGGPTLDAVSPQTAFAGEWIAIAGSGFAADPAGNLVQFASASARGETFDDEGRLLLRVPADAGTGLFTVTTSLGVSAPFGPFTYRGLGQLRVNQVSGRIDLLHKPYEVLAAGGETFLDSDLVVGVVRYGHPEFVAPFAQSSVALPAADAVAWYEASSGTARLVRFAVPGGATVEADVAAGQSVHLVSLPTSNRLALVRRGRPLDAPPLPTTVTIHDATTLGVVNAAVSVPLPVPHGCDDAGAGRLVCVYHEDFSQPARLAIVSPGVLPPATTLAPPAPLRHNDYDLEEDDPLCVAIGTAGRRVAVAGLQDGRLLVLDYDAGGAFSYVSTGSATPAQSITCPGGSTVLVAKTDDDLLVSVDVLTGATSWAASVPRAARMAVEDGVIHVASDASNVVELRDLASGELRARRSFDPLPGRDDGFGLQAAAWLPSANWDVPVLELVTGFPRGLLEVPVESTSGVTSVYPIYLDVDDAIGVIPGIAGGYLALRDEGLGNFDLGHAVQLGVDGPRDYYAGTWDGLVTVFQDAPVLSALDGSEFRSIGLHADGGVWGAVNRWDTGEFEVFRWTESAAAAGAPPTSSWSAPGPIDGAAVLGGTLWAFYWDGSEDHAVELSSALIEVRDVPVGDYLNQVLAVSPNGRTFVSWESQPFSENTSVVVWAADPAASFPRLATIPIEGQVTGAAFDPTGEKLFVLAHGPGRIVVVE